MFAVVYDSSCWRKFAKHKVVGFIRNLVYLKLAWIERTIRYVISKFESCPIIYQVELLISRATYELNLIFPYHRTPVFVICMMKGCRDITKRLYIQYKNLKLARAGANNFLLRYGSGFEGCTEAVSPHDNIWSKFSIDYNETLYLPRTDKISDQQIWGISSGDMFKISFPDQE